MFEAVGKDADCTAVRENPAEVYHFVVGRLDLDQHLGIGKIGDRYLLPGGENDVAAFGLQDSAVLDLGRDQDNLAETPDSALVFDTVLVCAFESQLPREEIRISDIQAGGDEAGGINAGALPENDAARVDEEDTAVGTELSEYLACLPANHAVEDRACRTLLLDSYRFAGTDVELLPVDDRIGRALDVEDVRLRFRDHRLASSYLGAGRQRLHRCGIGARKRARNGDGNEPGREP